MPRVRGEDLLQDLRARTCWKVKIESYYYYVLVEECCMFRLRGALFSFAEIPFVAALHCIAIRFKAFHHQVLRIDLATLLQIIRLGG